MCSILRVSKSSYYNWLKCGLSKQWLANERIMFFIKKIFSYSFECYEAPRIKEELKKYGYFVSRRRISKLMKLLGLFVRRSYKFRSLTDSHHRYPVAHNLLNQNFKVDREIKYGCYDLYIYRTRVDVFNCNYRFI